MGNIRLEQLGIALKNKRGNRGLREVAQELKISHTTLSRIEAGRQPDLDTFSKLCDWLELNPAEVLNSTSQTAKSTENQEKQLFAKAISVQFRAEKDLSPETANKLGEMILAVQQMIRNG